MRKDVKLLMSVCAILLILLIVYVLFVPGEKKGREIAQTAPAVTAPQETSSNTPAEPIAAPVPTTEPAENNTASATTQPAEPVNVTLTQAPGANTGDDWAKLLNTGQDTGAQNGSPTAAPTQEVHIASNTPTDAPAEAFAPSNSISAPQSSAPATGTRHYTVKPGDTLTSIAQAEYGNGRLYPKIIAANPRLNPRQLRVGQQLTIPDVHASAENSNRQETSSNSTGPHYTVQPGDSLQRISQKLYGNSNHWEKIYEMNKSKIGSSPARIRVGMVLELPQAPTSAAR